MDKSIAHAHRCIKCGRQWEVSMDYPDQECGDCGGLVWYMLDTSSEIRDLYVPIHRDHPVDSTIASILIVGISMLVASAIGIIWQIP